MPERKSNAWFPWNEVRLQSRVSSFSSRSLSKICHVNDCCIHACSVNCRACTKTCGSICICTEMQLRSWFLCLKDILLLRFYRALYLKTLIKGTLVSALKPSEMEKSAVATHFTDLNAENDDSSSLRAAPFSSRHWTVPRVFLLAVDHYGVVPLWSAGAAVLLDVLDHVCEVLRFLRHLVFARPLQELEMVYLPSVFPLWIEEDEKSTAGLQMSGLISGRGSLTEAE